MGEYTVEKQCAECPWRTDVPVGKFPPERFRVLARTCKPGGLSKAFACHMTAEEKPKACAGMLAVVGYESNRVRLLSIYEDRDVTKVQLAGPCFSSYREMAIANGVDPDDPALEGVA